MQTDQSLRTGTHVQVVDVLRQRERASRARPFSDDVVRGIRLAAADLLAPPRIPLPHQPWITCERLGRREIFRPIPAPQTLRPTKGRHTARGRDPGARQDRQSFCIPDSLCKAIQYGIHGIFRSTNRGDAETRRLANVAIDVSAIVNPDWRKTDSAAPRLRAPWL
jgi:hypothetical protein